VVPEKDEKKRLLRSILNISPALHLKAGRHLKQPQKLNLNIHMQHSSDVEAADALRQAYQQITTEISKVIIGQTRGC